MHALSEGPRTRLDLKNEGFGGMAITDANQWWARHGSHWRVRGHQTYAKNASGRTVRGYEYELLMENV